MDLHFAAALLLSGVIGVSLGLLGGGGSILALPVLVYVAGIDAKEAVGMSLAIVGATSLTASLMHHRKGQLDVKIAAIFGGAGILGAYFSSRLTHLVSSGILLLLFALLMLVVGALMLRRQQFQEQAGGINFPLVLAAGLSVGVLTGFLGVGGGFLVVPALVLLAKLPMRLAIGTSLLVIAINCAAGFAGHWGQGNLHPLMTLAFTVLAVGGSFVGERFAYQASPTMLRKWFAVFVIMVGIFLVARNYHALI